jgi:subtilisin family serine protease
MSADPVGPLLGGSIQHHAIAEPPSLVHHGTRDADFWIDPWAERDIEALLGDVEQTLASAHGSSGLTGVRNDYGFIGTGQTVAIIDSGIAWNHLALGNGLGANYRVVGGRDFTENDNDPYDDGPFGSHGTHVAGIVGADRAGTNDDGVAPGVDLVGLRVFNDNGDGFFSWVESALQWVHQNRNAFENPITAVNLSIGTTWNSTTVPAWSMLEDDFAQLKADGIFIAVSAGNSFTSYNTPGLSYPAASPHVVPVMASTDGGALASFSQRHTRAIAAPGRSIVSTVPDYAGNNNGITDDYAGMSGTSMAAPYVAGASVLLREAMQFVGYTNITQDTIYDHMMATASSFVDSVTGETYKRLNLTNAFNALMPTDEYGSTVGAAYNLGTLSGTSEISGLIGKLTDADFFRFTAAATGTVSFTADTTHGLAPVWTASGGTVSGSDGETYTFDVVAGQSYTIGLSTSGGIGYYDLSIEAEAEFTYVDWGTIAQAAIENVGNAGESWYRVTASRTGCFSAEAFFATGGGNIELAVYDSNLQWLAGGVATASGERVDYWANVGSDYFVCVLGTNSDLDFRLTNLVSQDGTTVSIAGTSAADIFGYSAGATHHTVNVNGVAYDFDRSAVDTINFAGGEGTDAISLTGSSDAEVATLRLGNAQLAGSDYIAVATSVENETTVIDFDRVMAYAGQGNDRAYFYDTDGDDTFTGRSDRAVMCGDGYRNEAYGFDRSDAYATLGTDRAYFYDSAGDDVYNGRPDRAVMYGSGFRNEAHNFNRTYAYASTGYDQAYFYDSAGDDTFSGRPDRAVMYGSGYRNEAHAFDRTYAFATQGNDRAYFYDSVHDDTYRGWADRAFMFGSGFFHEARGFDRTTAQSTAGGYDRAVLYDSAGDDLLVARALTAYLSGSEFRNDAEGFDQVTAQLINGGSNVADVGAIDFLLGLLGEWS